MSSDSPTWKNMPPLRVQFASNSHIPLNQIIPSPFGQWVNVNQQVRQIIHSSFRTILLLGSLQLKGELETGYWLLSAYIMNVPQASTTVSLELPGPPGLTVHSPPQGLRSWMFAGAAFVSGLVYLLRKGYSDGLRRRVIRKLDAVAPRSKYDKAKLNDGTIFNADCE